MPSHWHSGKLSSDKIRKLNPAKRKSKDEWNSGHFNNEVVGRTVDMGIK